MSTDRETSAKVNKPKKAERGLITYIIEDIKKGASSLPFFYCQKVEIEQVLEAHKGGNLHRLTAVFFLLFRYKKK